MTDIRIAGIVRNSIVDGTGFRYTIFAQGCPLNCPNCHNPDTHDPNGGTLMKIEEIADEIRKDPLLDGVTFTGGEPFAQVGEFARLAELIADYNIICYSGYTFEELFNDCGKRELLEKVNVLIDGRYEQSQRVLKLKFRGSKNQRVIDCKESVRCGKVIEYKF
jgi:anaerobic ribonucleoside-triphosphate reductase activating protein